MLGIRSHTVCMLLGHAALIQVTKVNRLGAPLAAARELPGWRKEAEQHLAPRIYFHQLSCKQVTQHHSFLSVSIRRIWLATVSLLHAIG